VVKAGKSPENNQGHQKISEGWRNSRALGGGHLE
jgi:hypothetical protein